MRFPRSVTLTPICRPSRSLNEAMDLRARVMTGCCPVITAGDWDADALETLKAEQFPEDADLTAIAPVLGTGLTLALTIVYRDRGITAVAAAVLSLAVLGFVRERMLRDAAQEARTVAQQEAAKAVAVSDFLQDLLGHPRPRAAEGVVVVELDPPLAVGALEHAHHAVGALGVAGLRSGVRVGVGAARLRKPGGELGEGQRGECGDKVHEEDRGETDAADRLEGAVASVIAEGQHVTYDMKPNRDDPTAATTSGMADAIIAAM